MNDAKELIEILQELERRQRQNKLALMYPEEGPLRRELYPKHMAFFAAGKTHRERCMLAANRVGKSFGAGGYETALHLTGLYPAWWSGRRFDHPIDAWAAGDSSKTTRDVIQKILLGEHHHHGTGLIPADCIVRTTPKPGIADGIEDIYVKHVSGGISHIGLKSYEQGPGSFMGTAKHVIWLDEEPPMDVYGECLTRTMIVDGAGLMEKTTGMVLATFTPLIGLSDVVLHFMPEGKFPESGERFVIQVTWDEVPHLSGEMKKSLWESLPPHQRDARSKGKPQLGSGAVYPFLEEDIVCAPFEIPRHWPRAYGMDPGYKKTAVVWGAWDRESDTVYLYSEHYLGNAFRVVHADAVKSRGAWIPGVMDRTSINPREGIVTFNEYLDLGLKLEIANNAVEAGIEKVLSRFGSGRLKIFTTLQSLLGELRIYRRDKHGKVVKQDDHLMDALRYLIMSGLDVAITEPQFDENYEAFAVREHGKSRVGGY